MMFQQNQKEHNTDQLKKYIVNNKVQILIEKNQIKEKNKQIREIDAENWKVQISRECSYISDKLANDALNGTRKLERSQTSRQSPTVAKNSIKSIELFLHKTARNDTISK